MRESEFARLDWLLVQIRDRTRWPPVPERSLVAASDEDLRKLALTEGEVLAMLKPASLEPFAASVPGCEQAVRRR